MEVVDKLAASVDEVVVPKDYRKMEDTPVTEMHGSIAVEKKKNWATPQLVTFCDVEARPGYATKLAHEYEDTPEVLKEKVKVLADLIRKSQRFVAYTGAGISTGSGIGDYATKSKESKAFSLKKKVKDVFAAEPTLAHYVFANLYHEGYLKDWVQQNHDGLPQKAGFPQGSMNEIHGAWFDPSNPVVPMTGSLRGDLFDDLQQKVKICDFCVAVGTSLSGMNADQLVTKTAHKAQVNKKVIGSVIIGLQKTQHDGLTKLRIFGKIDTVMALLAKEFDLNLTLTPHVPVIPKEAQAGMDIFRVPYTKDGKKVKGKKKEGTLWNLQKDAKVMVTQGPGTGYKGKVVGRTEQGHFKIELPIQREGHPLQGKGRQFYMLGNWWPETAINGEVAMLPIVNID